MPRNSVETLLARHYGSAAAAPAGLEQRLQASIQQQAVRSAQEQHTVQHTMSRRRAVQFVALSSLSVGVVNLGLEMLETALVGQEAAQSTITP
jgi:uncharacterized membrane protein YiaA